MANARADAMSREVLRHEEFRDKVELSRIRDWFICALSLTCRVRRLLIFMISAFDLLIPAYHMPSFITSSTHTISVNVESEGPYPPSRLLIEAVAVMREKIAVVRRAAASLEAANGGLDVDMG